MDILSLKNTGIDIYTMKTYIIICLLCTTEGKGKKGRFNGYITSIVYCYSILFVFPIIFSRLVYNVLGDVNTLTNILFDSIMGGCNIACEVYFMLILYRCFRIELFIFEKNNNTRDGWMEPRCLFYALSMENI